MESIQNLLFVISSTALTMNIFFFLVFSSLHIDRYCATESLSSLVKQHIPGSTLLQQNDQQIVYSLPFRDMDKFSGIVCFLIGDLDLAVQIGFYVYFVVTFLCILPILDISLMFRINIFVSDVENLTWK